MDYEALLSSKDSKQLVQDISGLWCAQITIVTSIYLLHETKLLVLVTTANDDDSFIHVWMNSTARVFPRMPRFGYDLQYR